MKLTVVFKQPKLTVCFKPPIVRDYIGFDIYDGEYVVEPSARSDIVLETKNKALLDDVTVNKIYYAETSNPANGKTVYIASHV